MARAKKPAPKIKPAPDVAKPAARDPETKQFLPGNKFSSGRPKGARNKLNEELLAGLLDVYERKGLRALEAMADERPAEFIRALVSILPRQVQVEQVDDMTDAELVADIKRIAANLGVTVAGLDGLAGAGEGAGPAPQPQPPGKISPLH